MINGNISQKMLATLGFIAFFSSYPAQAKVTNSATALNTAVTDCKELKAKLDALTKEITNLEVLIRASYDNIFSKSKEKVAKEERIRELKKQIGEIDPIPTVIKNFKNNMQTKLDSLRAELALLESETRALELEIKKINQELNEHIQVLENKKKELIGVTVLHKRHCIGAGVFPGMDNSSKKFNLDSLAK